MEHEKEFFDISSGLVSNGINLNQNLTKINNN